MIFKSGLTKVFEFAERLEILVPDVEERMDIAFPPGSYSRPLYDYISESGLKLIKLFIKGNLFI